MKSHIREKIKNYLRDGDTPAYFFDLHGIKVRMMRLSEIASHHKIKILFAVKSFSEPTILNLASTILSGFDVSNYREFLSIRKCIKRNHILSVTGPDPRIQSFMNGEARCSPIFNIENSVQLQEFEKYKNHWDLGVRLDLGLLTSPTLYSSLSTVRNYSRFGLREDELRTIITQKPRLKKYIKGFHIHCGSERNTVGTYLNIAQKISEIINREEIKIQFINFGGGLHNFSFKNIGELFRRLRLLFPHHLDIYFEPGRFFSRDTGYVGAQILSSKSIINSSTIREYYLILNVSYYCHLMWSYVKPDLPSWGKHKVKVTFFGNTCYEGDIIYRGECYVNLRNKLPWKSGTYLILKNICGYSVSLSRSFNGLNVLPIYFL